MADKSSSSKNEQNVTIYNVEPGDAVELSVEDKLLCITAIRKHDPMSAGIKSAIRSLDSLHLVDLFMDDGALWQLHMHPIGLLIPTLRILSTNYQGKMLTSDIACVYSPERDNALSKAVSLDIRLANIPEVDCGEGYRQLRFNEKIRKSDEWYAGPVEGWKKTKEDGSSYWPSHSNIGGPYSLMRRAIPTNKLKDGE